MPSKSLTLPSLNGDPCIVMGGGPSMMNFRPEDLPFLRIGVNFCAPWDPDIVFIFDLKAIRLVTGWTEIPAGSIPRWWDLPVGAKYAQVWKDMRALKVTWMDLRKDVEEHPDNETEWLYLTKLNQRDPETNHPPWSMSMERLTSSSNSGIPALNIADLSGAGTIYMVGFDMDAPNDRHNWHTCYPDCWSGPNPDKYRLFRIAFGKVVPQHVIDKTLVVGPSRLDECGFTVIKREEYMERVHATSRAY